MTAFVPGEVEYRLRLVHDQEWGLAYLLETRGPALHLWWPIEIWPVWEGAGIW